MRVSGQHHTSTALPREKKRGTHCTEGHGGPQGRSGRVRKILPWLGFDPRTFQAVARHCTDWAVPADTKDSLSLNFIFVHTSTCKVCKQYEGQFGYKVLLLLLVISAVSAIYYRYRYNVHRLRYRCVHAHIPWIQNLVKITKRHGIGHKSTKWTIHKYYKYSNTVLSNYMTFIIYNW